MLEYWSMWNLNWWLASEFGLCSMNGPLKTSILYTSIVGGYITYIYPRKMTINKYRIPYEYCILLDILGHQVPLMRMLTNKKNMNNLCGAYVLIPVSIYSFINYYRNINVHRIYGINMYKIYGTCFLIISGYGFRHHIRK